MVTSPVDVGPPSGRTSFEGSVVGYGTVEATRAEIAKFRDAPSGPGGPPIPPRFLRNCDEQTVVGLVAVLRAMAASSSPSFRDGESSPPLRGGAHDTHDWGVLAAPQYPGRLVAAATQNRFAQNGPSSVSPHVIPQHSLHSAAGAISVALGLHGPNFGIGGGSEAIGECFTAALTFLSAAVPGLWLVLTGWDPEPIPDGKGSTETESVCRAVALAMVPGACRGGMLRLTAGPPLQGNGQAAWSAASPSLADLVAYLSAGDRQDGSWWCCDLPWGGRVELLAHAGQQKKAA